VILTQARGARKVILTIGANKLLRPLAEQMTAALLDMGLTLYCLGVNADGSPRHPLYMPGDIRPVVWKGWNRGPEEYTQAADDPKPDGV
jgi:hypothetical protein